MNRPSLGRRGRVCGGTWERVARLVGENEEKWNMCGAIEVARAWGLSVSRESEPLVSWPNWHSRLELLLMLSSKSFL